MSTIEQDTPQHGIEYYYDSNGFGRLVRMVEKYDNLTVENKITYDAYDYDPIYHVQLQFPVTMNIYSGAFILLVVDLW